MKTLVLTVGGSPAPLIRSIVHAPRPDSVVFVCSEDDPVTGRQGSHSEVAAIVKETGLEEGRYRIERVPADDPARILGAMRGLLREVAEVGDVTADFTGGTKSMSAGLLLAAASQGSVEVRVVTGARDDLKRVRDGLELVQEVAGVHAQWARDHAGDAWRSHRYGDAARVLEAAGQLDADLKRLLMLSRAFALWDELAYPEAAAGLRSLARYAQPWMGGIGALERFRAGTSKDAARDEAMALTDVLNMAERRERQGLWDVSIFLRYRALEWVAQWSLRHDHGIDTSNVGADAPEGVRQRAHEDHRGKLVLSMEAGWQALAALDGPLASLAMETKGPRKDVSQLRNASVLAHGVRPLTEDDSVRVRELLDRVMPAFWKHACGAPKCPLRQLPRELSDVGQ